MRVPLVAALAVNQTWSMDFVSDAICRPGVISRRIKCLTVTDDFTRECVGITADFGIGDYGHMSRVLRRKVIDFERIAVNESMSEHVRWALRMGGHFECSPLSKALTRCWKETVQVQNF